MAIKVKGPGLCMNPRVSTCLKIFAALLLCASSLTRCEEPKKDDHYPFRTDFANAHLPWYSVKPGEFPPHHSDRRIGGELVQLDFIHRTGQFRRSKTGELVTFNMPPYASINYLCADAVPSSVPLGTFFLFFLNADANQNFNQLATMQDQYTMDMGHGFVYRLDEIKLGEGKLLTTKIKPSENNKEEGKREMLVTEQTQVWRNEELIKLSDLKVGDELLFNSTGVVPGPSHCSDIWVGKETHKLTTDKERKKFNEYLKDRGLAAWIDKVDGGKMTVALFSGDDRAFRETYANQLTVGKTLQICVANTELRTYNPPVDNERSNILEVQKVPLDFYGCSGIKLVVEPKHMLEGFRKNRVVRLFLPGAKLHDMPFGEGLYRDICCDEVNEKMPREYPLQYPFRTDYGGENLPWYQLKDGEVPPHYSAHLVMGELVKVDPETRSGQFKTEGTGALVDFTLTKEGAYFAINQNKREDNGPVRFKDSIASIMYLNAPADLNELPLGTRYRFHTYPDDKGAFTRVSLITDEFSDMARNKVTWEVEAIDLAQNKLILGRKLPEILHYSGDFYQPPKVGRTEMKVSPEARVWKGEQQVKLADLKIGDEIFINLTSEQAGTPAKATEIWIGTETQKNATEQQLKKHPPVKK